MLKIKDNIELRELEKFGFIFQKDMFKHKIWLYDFNDYKREILDLIKEYEDDSKTNV